MDFEADGEGWPFGKGGLGFADSLGDGVYGVDRDGNCRFVNDAALRLLGYVDRQEVLGHNMHRLIHHTRPDGSVYRQADCPLLHAIDTGVPVRLDHETLWRRDGTSFLAEYSSFPVHGAEGVIGSIVTFVDTATRLDAQRRLAVQYAISRLLGGEVALEAVPERVLAAIGGGLSWDVGLFWVREPAEVDGEHQVLKCRAVWRSATAGHAGGFAGPEALGMTLEFGAGLPGQAWVMEEPVRVADLAVGAGRQAEAARYGLRSGFAFPVMAGPRVMGAVEFYLRQRIDVDPSLLETVSTLGQQIGQTLERRRVESALRDNEARLRTVVDSIPQLTWMTGPDGSIRWYNERWYEYTGTTAKDMAGWGWRTVHHPDHLERVERNLRASFKAGTRWEDTFPLRGADGGYRWFLSRAEPIWADPEARREGGQPVGWFGTNTDVTDMRDSEQRLVAARDEAEAANRAKSTFLANMSHELRTPLSAIIGYAEMLVEELEEAPEPGGQHGLVSDLGKIETNARHLLGLINDVLDLSKVEAGKMEAFAETFDVAEMVEAVASTVEALIEKNGNRLVLAMAAGLGSMRSDVTRVRQVLLNLLSNAAKFTKDGVITLGARRLEGPERLEFAVSDTGIGMTAEQLEKLFQRFQQADASTTRQFGGTGLGLALSKAFTSLLGGTMDVSSVAGQGSRFMVTLPAAMQAAVAEAIDPAVLDGRPPVLVIDDDATQRDLVSRFLRREGYAVLAAADGASGLALAREHLPHAILLDVSMPGMDGWSVLATLKADPMLQAVPVVMVTFALERELAASLGADEYVSKPVDWERLRQVMERFRAEEGAVLVVEDDGDARERLRHALEREGWQVAEASNGQEALDRCSKLMPMLILLDLQMPVMDGFEFLRALRDLPGGETVPVVVLTAKDLSRGDMGRLHGADQVMLKKQTGLDDIAATLRHLGGAR